jgi:hypothetical protein
LSEKVDTVNLCTKTTLLLEEQDIAEILSHLTTIEIASDGGFNPSTGISSFGWVVAMNKTLVAMGRGPAAAHPDLAESFRAEGYVLAAVSWFLTVLAAHYKIDKQKHTWKFYIDNKAMIQRMLSYQWKEKSSKWNLRPDADITNFADEHLRNFPASLIHVKSHQDEHKETDVLPFDAQLNVLADAQATLQHDLMDAPMTKVRGLQPTLQIGDRCITRDSQKWLLQKAGEIPIAHQYNEKYGWNHNTFQDIDWDLQHKALSTFSDSDQRRILKFVHGWLPTNRRLFREGIEPSPKCILCDHLEENSDHILICTHDSLESIRLQLVTYLCKDTNNHGNTELNNILELAIQEGPHNEKWRPITSETSPSLQHCILQQSQIGWSHLFRGRLTKSLVSFMDQHYRSLNVDSRRYNGQRWCKLLIINVWNTVLQLWNKRNELIHRTSESIQTSQSQKRLEHRIQICYEWKDKLTRDDREKLFYMEEDELAKEDQRFIKAWLRMTERTIKTAKKEAQQHSNSRKLMESFIQWRPSSKTRRRTASELQPD